MSEMVTFENNVGPITNTFDDKTENAKLIFNATSNSDSLNDHMGEVIKLKGAFMTNGVRRGYNDAPDTPCINTYIVDENNKSYFTQSKGIARDMTNLLTLFKGQIEGLNITIGERKLADNRSIKFIELV